VIEQWRQHYNTVRPFLARVSTACTRSYYTAGKPAFGTTTDATNIVCGSVIGGRSMWRKELIEHRDWVPKPSNPLGSPCGPSPIGWTFGIVSAQRNVGNDQFAFGRRFCILTREWLATYPTPRSHAIGISPGRSSLTDAPWRSTQQR